MQVSVSSQRPGVRIQPLEDYCWRTERSGFHSLNDGPQVEEFFHCINNCFVDRLTLSFRPNTHPFLYYLRARANDLQCHIRALHLEYFIWENDVREEEIDYALVDFLGVHLKPNVFEMSAHYECCEDNAMLFTHGALRENVKHLAYKVSEAPQIARFTRNCYIDRQPLAFFRYMIQPQFPLYSFLDFDSPQIFSPLV